MNNVFEYDSNGEVVPSNKSIRTFDDSDNEYLRQRVSVGGKLKKRSELTPEEKLALAKYEEERERRKRLGIIKK